ncbi:Hpt domain protein [uncultured archaeon]|nr:Hpt domain protein [uncultured archaeon]
MGEEQSGVLDQTVLANLRELQDVGEPDIVAEVGGLFIEHAPGKIAAIKKAASEGNARALELAAHSLKSSSSYIGALKLSAFSKELEFMGRNGALEGSVEKAALVETEFERVKAALEAEIGK